MTTHEVPDHADRATAHVERTRRALEALAVDLAERGLRRLPSEEQLALDLGVSRPTVRSALQSLQLTGTIVRRHGAGTFVNRYAAGLPANLASDVPFLDIIERLGAEPTLEVVRLEATRLSDAHADRLDLPRGGGAVTVDRVFRADGRPVVHSRDVVPASLLTVPASGLSAESSTFAFVRRWTERQVGYSAARLRAVTAGTELANALDVAEDHPLVLLDHLHVDLDDRPVAITEAHVRDDRIPLTAIRSGTDL